VKALYSKGYYTKTGPPCQPLSAYFLQQNLRKKRLTQAMVHRKNATPPDSGVRRQSKEHDLFTKSIQIIDNLSPNTL
jgi:hypothetical protein